MVNREKRGESAMKCERCKVEITGVKHKLVVSFGEVTLCSWCMRDMERTYPDPSLAELDAIRQAREVDDRHPCEYCRRRVDPEIKQTIFGYHLCTVCQDWVSVYGHEPSKKARDILTGMQGGSTELKLNAQWAATGRMVDQLFEET